MLRSSNTWLRYSLRLVVASSIALGCTEIASAGTITIAAAADLKFAMDEIVGQFNAQNRGEDVSVVYGSSGKFLTQIRQGAPFDLFFSADITLAQMLVKEGLAVGPARPQAVGRIVLWSARMDATKLTLDDLPDPQITHIAIANPKLAPYGKRAEQALRRAGVWDKIESKIVYGENSAQTAQFVQVGTADVGLIPLSLALNQEIARAGGYGVIPDSLHDRLDHGFVLMRRAAGNPLALSFAHHVEQPAARGIMARYGFALSGPLPAPQTNP